MTDGREDWHQRRGGRINIGQYRPKLAARPVDLHQRASRRRANWLLQRGDHKEVRVNWSVEEEQIGFYKEEITKSIQLVETERSYLNHQIRSDQKGPDQIKKDGKIQEW